MHLSRLILNSHHHQVRRDLANLYDLHRTLMSAFPDDLPEKERILFRIDADPRTNVSTVLIQSHTAPNWTILQDRADYILPESQCPPRISANPVVKTFDLAITVSQTLAFRLRANPTVKHRRERDDGKLRPVRDPLYREQDQRDWLARKGEQDGFRLLRVTVIQEGNQLAWKPRSGGGKRKLTHFAVRFDGVLQVTDPELLWSAVRRGVGPGKGLGFGLLSLARPS
jgi:CRISPR system Cascade subunit CasE